MKQCCTVVLLVLLVGCGTSSHVVRLETSSTDSLVFTPRSGAKPVAISPDEFKQAVAALAREARPPAQPQEAARRLFEVAARSGSYMYEPRSRQLTPLQRGEHQEGSSTTLEEELTRDYLRWCERTGRPGDCLRLLTESPTVYGDGRFALALALAKGAMLDEMLEAFKDMVDPHALVAAALWTWTTYMVLVSIPDVTISKGLAAVMTATLISYVGVETFWGLVVGFKRMMDEADRASGFNALRVVGERYGKLMGRNAARASAMLALAAIGNTAQGLAATVPRSLPGSMQAAVQAETQVGLRLAAVGEVETVAVSAGAVIIALAPGAVAMSASRGSDNAHATKDASDVHVDKAVNSNMPHAAERAVERAGFSSTQEARAALQGVWSTNREVWTAVWSHSRYSPRGPHHRPWLGPRRGRRVSSQGWRTEAENRFAVEGVMGQIESKKKTGRFELQISEDDQDVAYLRLPSHPGETCKMSKSIRLTEVLGTYTGPDVTLDFDQAGVLVGIEILA